MSSTKRIEQMVAEMGHLLGADNDHQNQRWFREPTSLMEVPSYTSNETVCKPEAGGDAELGKRAQ